MLRSYIITAIRNIRRHKFFSFINIFGLAISMSVCLGIIMLVADQMMYDQHNTNKERIYRVVTRYLNPDGSMAGNDYSTAPQPVATSLLEDYNGVEKAVRIRRGFGNGWIEFEQDLNVPLGGFFMDQDGLSLFEYELEFGDPVTALTQPYSVVLTKNAAKKLFKQHNPVGQIIKVGSLGEYTVTGVIKENDHQKSHIVFEALASYSTLESLEAKDILSGHKSDWGNFTSGWVYLLLKKDHTSEQIETYLNALAKKQRPTRQTGSDERAYQFYLQNLTSITPGPFINNPIGPFMPRVFIYFFGALAIIIMLTACFNYTNLSIARAISRGREIGVRKVSGAFRTQIFTQFIAESVVIALLAQGLALLFLVVLRPFILNLKFAQVLKWDLEGNLHVYAVFILFALLTGVLAGFFPAVFLSKINAIKVLRSAGTLNLFSRIGLRKFLVVVQFSLSLIFIISVLLLYNQLQLFISADHGFDIQNKINIKLNNAPYKILQNELALFSNIENVSAASHIPATGITYGDGFKRELSDHDATMIDFFYVDANYLSNMDISLTAGRNFEEMADEMNKQFILINEQAVAKFQFETSHDAVGEILFCAQDSARYEIIGVVRNYNHQVLMSEIGPMALKYDPQQFNILQVKYNGSYDEAVKTIEQTWSKINPSFKLDYKDFEEEVRFFYKTVFTDLVGVIGVIAFMAIVISCLGLLGMATYTTETRLKEISIRRVLGSGDYEVVFLLSKGFLTLLLVAVMIGVPAAWLINNLWLQRIAYRTPFNVTVVGSGIAMLLVFGVLTIGSQTLRALFANPAETLRNNS